LQTYKNNSIYENICNITQKDAQRLSALSSGLLGVIFDTKVPELFFEDFTTEEFEKRISCSWYKHFGYVIDNSIVGYISIKDNKHLYHLFVDEKYQKQGIAKKLWEFVKENIEFETMTTNASLSAINVYESFGFEIDAKVQIHNELKYQPMVYKK
jgi:ribosomal protein S18 acetylase RimI-like enzyme